ncbi:MAG: hypothetical protein ACE5HW_04775 [Candidatus Methanofastidiosia archaeon]
MAIEIIFRLAMAILGTGISFFLAYYVLSRGDVNWIKRSFAIYCFSAGVYLSTRLMRIWGNYEFYSVVGMLFTMVFAMFGVPVGLLLFSRLLTHGEEKVFKRDVLLFIIGPPFIVMLVGLVFRPWNLVQSPIGPIPIFDPPFRVLYNIIVFGWMLIATFNVGLAIKRITDEKFRAKLTAVRNGLLGIVLVSFVAYGIAINVGWHNVNVAGDFLNALLQAYIAYSYMK